MTSAKMRILHAYMRRRSVARPEVVCAWGFGFSFGGSLPVGAGLWPFKFHHNEVSKSEGRVCQNSWKNSYIPRVV